MGSSSSRSTIEGRDQQSGSTGCLPTRGRKGVAPVPSCAVRKDAMTGRESYQEGKLAGATMSCIEALIFDSKTSSSNCGKQNASSDAKIKAKDDDDDDDDDAGLCFAAGYDDGRRSAKRSTCSNDNDNILMACGKSFSMSSLKNEEDRRLSWNIGYVVGLALGKSNGSKLQTSAVKSLAHAFESGLLESIGVDCMYIGGDEEFEDYVDEVQGKREPDIIPECLMREPTDIPLTSVPIPLDAFVSALGFLPACWSLFVSLFNCNNVSVHRMSVEERQGYLDMYSPMLPASYPHSATDSTSSSFARHVVDEGELCVNPDRSPLGDNDATDNSDPELGSYSKPSPTSRLANLLRQAALMQKSVCPSVPVLEGICMAKALVGSCGSVSDNDSVDAYDLVSSLKEVQSLLRRRLADLLNDVDRAANGYATSGDGGDSESLEQLLAVKRQLHSALADASSERCMTLSALANLGASKFRDECPGDSVSTTGGYDHV